MALYYNGIVTKICSYQQLEMYVYCLFVSLVFIRVVLEPYHTVIKKNETRCFWLENYAHEYYKYGLRKLLHSKN